MGVKKRYLTDDSTITKPREKTRKTTIDDRERKMFIAKCTQVLESKPSDTEALGIYISAKLEKVTDMEQRMFAESLLTKVLNRAIMGNLRENTDIIDIIPQHYSQNLTYINSSSPSTSSAPVVVTPLISPVSSCSITENSAPQTENQTFSSNLRSYFGLINETNII